MTKEQAIILASILLLNVLWSSIKLLFQLIANLTDYLAPKCYNDQKWVQNAPYTDIVQETIYYTNNILYNAGIEYFPPHKIYYYKHKKHFGHFDSRIVIYTGNHENVIELVDTVLHEVKHFIQSETDEDYKNYETYTKQYGIWDNPLEQQAREFASEHLRECLYFLEERGLVKRS